MGSIIWNNKTILEFNGIDKEFIAAQCNAADTEYFMDDENIIIFPPLSGNTIILKAVTQHNELKAIIKKIEKGLVSQGAAVVIDEGLTDKTSLEYLDAQLLIAFSFAEKEKDLTVYLPFGNQENSIFITKQLLKQLTVLGTKISYKIADTWNKLTAAKYWTYVFNSSTPTLVVEIAIPSVSESFLKSFSDILVKSIVDEFGYKPSNEERSNILIFFENLNQKILDKKQEKLELLISQLKDCQCKLDGIILSNKQAEEEVQCETMHPITAEIKYLKKPETKHANELKTKKSQSYTKKEQKQKNSANIAKELKEGTKKKKNTAMQLKNMYLPVIPRKENRILFSYKQESYPIKIPGGGPVYEFQRPQQSTQSMSLPLNLSLKNIYNGKCKSQHMPAAKTNVYGMLYPKS